MQAGAGLVPLVVPPAEEDPWVEYAGIFRDDALFDEWVELMAENRRRDQEEFERGQQEAEREQQAAGRERAFTSLTPTRRPCSSTGM